MMTIEICLYIKNLNSYVIKFIVKIYLFNLIYILAKKYYICIFYVYEVLFTFSLNNITYFLYTFIQLESICLFVEISAFFIGHSSLIFQTLYIVLFVCNIPIRLDFRDRKLKAGKINILIIFVTYMKNLFLFNIRIL